MGLTHPPLSDNVPKKRLSFNECIIIVHYCRVPSADCSMDPLEEYVLSESEADSSGELNPYSCVPVFETEPELRDFSKTVDTKTKVDEEDIEYDLEAKKECVCHNCEDIYSGTFEHICCQQYENWKKYVDEQEKKQCVTVTSAFQQATNPFAVRNLLLQLHRQKKIKISDPPENN